MMREPLLDYAKAYAEFRWELPDSFNFGRDVVDAIARETPDRLALICTDDAGGERRYSFGDMRRLSNRCARVLESLGVRRGDRVLVMLPRIVQWQVAMLGCLKLGAVPVPCIEMLTAKDIAYRRAHAGAVAAITTAASTVKFDDEANALKARLAVGADAPGWVDFDAALAAQPDHFDAADLALDEPAIIYYTSGSTGMPKGVTHAARAIFCWRASAWSWLDLRADDLIWCTADTGWSKAGTSILFGPWSRGAAVLFHNGRFDAAQRLARIAAHKVSVFCAAATEFRHLVHQDFAAHDLSPSPGRPKEGSLPLGGKARGAKGAPFPALRHAVSAGEAVNPEVLKRWFDATGVPLIEAYGQTETLMTVGNHRNAPLEPGSMGRPLPGCRMAVLDDDGAPLPAGERGQLALMLPNPQLMLGYWNDAERSAQSRRMHAGIEYFVTGDMAHADADGYLYYDGRADDIIASAGYRIGPAEVENALIEHPAVTECAVVGSPDVERGEIVKAFVILRPGFSPSAALVAELQEHVKRVTAPYKYPRAVQFVAELPKTASGKLLRRVLRDAEYERAQRLQEAGCAGD